jgi:hypothetical protein
MNRIRMLAAFALVFAANALAETPPPEGASAIPLVAQPAMEASAEPRRIEIVQRPAINARRAQRDADARHCLAHATNKQVHRCAEKYRTRTKAAVAARSERSPSASAQRRTAAAE